MCCSPLSRPGGRSWTVAWFLWERGVAEWGLAEGPPCSDQQGWSATVQDSHFESSGKRWQCHREPGEVDSGLKATVCSAVVQKGGWADARAEGRSRSRAGAKPEARSPRESRSPISPSLRPLTTQHPPDCPPPQQGLRWSDHLPTHPCRLYQPRWDHLHSALVVEQERVLLPRPSTVRVSLTSVGAV